MPEVTINLVGVDMTTFGIQGWSLKKDAAAALAGLRSRGLNVEDCVRIHRATSRLFRFWVIARPDQLAEMTWIMDRDGTWAAGRMYDDTGHGAPWTPQPQPSGRIPATITHNYRYSAGSEEVIDEARERWGGSLYGGPPAPHLEWSARAGCVVSGCGWSTTGTDESSVRAAARAHRTDPGTATSADRGCRTRPRGTPCRTAPPALHRRAACGPCRVPPSRTGPAVRDRRVLLDPPGRPRRGVRQPPTRGPGRARRAIHHEEQLMSDWTIKETTVPVPAVNVPPVLFRSDAWTEYEPGLSAPAVIVNDELTFSQSSSVDVAPETELFSVRLLNGWPALRMTSLPPFNVTVPVPAVKMPPTLFQSPPTVTLFDPTDSVPDANVRSLATVGAPVIVCTATPVPGWFPMYSE